MSCCFQCIDSARDILDTDLTAMVGESYNRAYGVSNMPFHFFLQLVWESPGMYDLCFFEPSCCSRFLSSLIALLSSVSRAWCLFRCCLNSKRFCSTSLTKTEQKSSGRSGGIDSRCGACLCVFVLGFWHDPNAAFFCERASVSLV